METSYLSPSYKFIILYILLYHNMLKYNENPIMFINLNIKVTLPYLYIQ